MLPPVLRRPLKPNWWTIFPLVATRALVALGEALVPAATLQAVNDEGTAEAVPMPRLRLDEAAARRRA